MSFTSNPSKMLTSTSVFVLDCLPAIVGRDADCDICLRDPWVSRLHCEFSEISGQLVVLDLESRHGIFVNGHRVRFAHLLPGDSLLVGRTRLVVEDGGNVLRVLPSSDDILTDSFRLGRAKPR